MLGATSGVEGLGISAGTDGGSSGTGGWFGFPEDKVMSRRNWRLSGTGEAWVLPGHGYQFPHSIQSYPEVEGTPQRRPVSPSGRQLLEGEWRWKGQGEVEAGEGRVWGGLRGLSPPCISSHQFSVPRHSGHGGLLLLLVGGFHH